MVHRIPFPHANSANGLLVAVLPLAGASAGHRLGVNGLAVDQDRSILYALKLPIFVLYLLLTVHSEAILAAETV